MMKRPLALFASTLAIAAGSVVVVSTPATASSSFTPTTGIVPGTVFNDMTVTAEPGNFLCEVEGTETTNSASVTFGLVFLSSGDTVADPADGFLGNISSEPFSYVAGSTTSPAFDLVMPILEPRDPANNILAIPFCFDGSVESGVDQGSYVIGYSDATIANSNVSQGGSATVRIIDTQVNPDSFTTTTCDIGTSGPYTMGIEAYASFYAYANGDDPVMVIPEGWDRMVGGPGFGSFTQSELLTGVEASFTVPTSLPVGDYFGAVFCISEDGFWGDSPSLGLVPLSVKAASLPTTGVNAAEVAGAAALGSSLLALGGIVWVLRRRSAKA